MKFCPKCKINKELEDFAKNRTTKDGVNSWCRVCKRASDKTLRKNPNRGNIGPGRKKLIAQPGQTKQCVNCYETLPLDRFYNQNKKKGSCSFNKTSRCKECYNIMKRRKYWINPKMYRDQIKNWVKKNEARAKTNALRALLKNRYGLTLDQYYHMLENQSHKCAICGEIPNKRLVVDHNHKTSKVRSLLCGFCNTMLGHAKERIDVLIAGARYLQYHQEPVEIAA